MNRRETPLMAFADYGAASHGFNDFYDALRMFCSNDRLGPGIGNVDRNYPLFGIPTLRFGNLPRHCRPSGCEAVSATV